MAGVVFEVMKATGGGERFPLRLALAQAVEQIGPHLRCGGLRVQPSEEAIGASEQHAVFSQLSLAALVQMDGLASNRNGGLGALSRSVGKPFGHAVGERGAKQGFAPTAWVRLVRHIEAEALPIGIGDVVAFIRDALGLEKSGLAAFGNKV